MDFVVLFVVVLFVAALVIAWASILATGLGHPVARQSGRPPAQSFRGRCLVAPDGLAATVGLASALTRSSPAPMPAMIPKIGPVARAHLLVRLALAHLGSLPSPVQGNGRTLLQHFGAWLQGLGSTRVTLLVTLGAAVRSWLASDALHDCGGRFMAYPRAVRASFTGIAFADHVRLRATAANVRALYADGGGTPYHLGDASLPSPFSRCSSASSST